MKTNTAVLPICWLFLLVSRAVLSMVFERVSALGYTHWQSLTKINLVRCHTSLAVQIGLLFPFPSVKTIFPTWVVAGYDKNHLIFSWMNTLNTYITDSTLSVAVFWNYFSFTDFSWNRHNRTRGNTSARHEITSQFLTSESFCTDPCFPSATATWCWSSKRVS